MCVCVFFFIGEKVGLGSMHISISVVLTYFILGTRSFHCSKVSVGTHQVSEKLMNFAVR